MNPVVSKFKFKEATDVVFVITKIFRIKWEVELNKLGNVLGGKSENDLPCLMDVSSGQKDNKGVAHSSAEFPNQMYDFWRPNLNLICLWRMIHVGAKREQALNQNNLNAGPAERVQSCALWVVSRLMGAAGISSEMETGGDAYDSTSHKQHQHFLWCTLNKSCGTMRARSFVAMVIEGFFFSCCELNPPHQRDKPRRDDSSRGWECWTDEFSSETLCWVDNLSKTHSCTPDVTDTVL